MDESKASLYKKLATVMGDMNNIPKTGVNSYFKYKFVTAEAIADAVRQRLASQNVAFFASISKRELVSIPTGKTDKNGEIITVNRWVIDFEFTFADGDTGATDTRLWSAEAGADDDKGINKCATAAEKYFFLKTFIVNTGDEPDSDGDETTHSQNGAKKVTPAQPSATVRGAGVQPTRPTPPTASPAANPAPSGVSVEPDPLAEFGMEAGATVTPMSDDDPRLYHCDILIVNRSKGVKQYALAIVNSRKRIAPVNPELLKDLHVGDALVKDLDPGNHDLIPSWSVYAEFTDAWHIDKIVTGMGDGNV